MDAACRAPAWQLVLGLALVFPGPLLGALATLALRALRYPLRIPRP